MKSLERVGVRWQIRPILPILDPFGAANLRFGISHSGAGPFLSSLSLGQKRIEFVNELIVLSTLCACFYPWGFRRLSQGIFAELRGQCESGGPAWSRSVPFERFRQLAPRWIRTQHSPPRSWRDGLRVQLCGRACLAQPPGRMRIED